MKKIDIRNDLPRHATKKWKKRDKITHIIVHTTASDNQDPFKTARYHISSNNHISPGGCPGITYHDFITKEGIIYHCSDYQDWIWHAGLYNKHSVGVVMAFKGQVDIISPTEKQYDALLKHLVVLCLYFKVLPSNVIGHREVPGMFTILGKGSVKYKKTCPGMSVNLDRLRSEVTLYLQRRLAAEDLYHGKIDGIFGPLSQKALDAFNPLKPRLI
jgi:N-acetyl-anhydromuramyl-L-alanine amidase AmpD